MSKIQKQLEAVRAKITELQATEAKLVEQLAGEVNTDEIAVGDGVKIAIGKGTTRREVEGVVIGIKEAADDKSTRLFRVAVGEGFDSSIETVGPVSIKAVTKAEAAAQA